MAIRIFFEYNNRLIQLPVNPGELEIVLPGKNKSLEIVKLGDVSLLGTPGLKTCKLASFFPKNANAPYVLTSGDFKNPDFYVEFFESVMYGELPMRMIVTDTPINMLVSLENFTHSKNAMTDDEEFSISVKEYKTSVSKVLQLSLTSNTKVLASSTSATQRPQTGYAIGDVVIVSGNYWYNSYGANPHGTFKNFEGKINHIVADKSRQYRFHITSLSGGAKGWVSESQLSRK